MARNTRESKVEQKFRKGVESLGGEALKIPASPYGRAGIPDRLVIFPGLPMHFVELKRDTTDLRTNQRAFMKMLVNRGHSGFVVYGDEGVKEYLDTMSHKRYPTEAGLYKFRGKECHIN